MQLSHKKKLKLISGLTFVVLLITISIYYNYHQYLFYRPQSVHAWRQADCASITLNYYQKDANFFKPQTHNLNSDGGTSSYCATSELPILYYFSSLLYKLFGPHEFILRLLNTLIFYIGLFYLFKIFVLVIKDYFWAAGLSLLFFASPVLVYYGNNYLTNVSALSFSIIGLFFFLMYLKEHKKKSIITSLIFFLLAGTFKIPALMIFLAIGGYILYDYQFLKKKDDSRIKYYLYYIIGSIIVIIPIVAWIAFARNYNECHDCSYFSTTTFPIWTYSIKDTKYIFKDIYKNWFDSYFHFSAFIFFGFLTLLLVIKFRRIKQYFNIILFLLIIQSIVFIALQFWTFKDHDYYTIGQYIVPVFITVGSFSYLREYHSNIIDSWPIKVIFSIFILFNIYHCNKVVEDRYLGWRNIYYHERKDIYTITPYLRGIGINSDDKIIYIPDGSNVALYLMNQFGWTQYTDAKFNRSEAVKYNQDSLGISKSINEGANFLIINSESDIYKYPFLMPFTTHLKGQWGKALIFDLKDTVQNYTLKNRKLVLQTTCNCELVNQDGYFVSNQNVLFGNGTNQSAEVSYESNYSCKVNAENPYGMTFKTNEIRGGDRFIVQVWRHGATTGNIVISGPPEINFYHTENRIKETSTNGKWDKIQLDAFIPEKMSGQELKIYVYNPSSESAYFDSLNIAKYRY